jgi:hypothetical protein
VNLKQDSAGKNLKQDLDTEQFPVNISYFCVCLCDNTGVWIHGLTLLGRCSTTWATPPVFFALVIFEIRSHIYAWAGLDHDPSIYACCIGWDDRLMPPGPAFYWLGWNLMNFLPRLASNCNPPHLCLLSSQDYRRELLCPVISLNNILSVRAWRLFNQSTPLRDAVQSPANL